jgi:hypothetical protein
LVKRIAAAPQEPSLDLAYQSNSMLVPICLLVGEQGLCAKKRKKNTTQGCGRTVAIENDDVLARQTLKLLQRALAKLRVGQVVATANEKKKKKKKNHKKPNRNNAKEKSTWLICKHTAIALPWRILEQ